MGVTGREGKGEFQRILEAGDPLLKEGGSATIPKPSKGKNEEEEALFGIGAGKGKEGGRASYGKGSGEERKIGESKKKKFYYESRQLGKEPYKLERSLESWLKSKKDASPTAEGISMVFGRGGDLNKKALT